MASYDASRGCYVIRVVYDGPGYAGKTTNLERISQMVPATRRSEMYTPAALKGRTMFFDWLEVDGPKHFETSLKFQLISVPGQIERNYRRKPLVEMADVLVFVCDSSVQKMPDSLRCFARLRSSIKQRETPVPLVVQANKQDTPGAASLEEIAARLGLAAEVPLVSAAACTGAGVQETLRWAARFGVDGLRKSGNVDLLPPEFANADALFDHVLGFEDVPNPNAVVEVEEVDVHASYAPVNEAALAAHLSAASMDSLLFRARKAAARNPEEPEAPPAE
ncbi:MAG TPA: GTPase domain-containing protein [Polyangiaceae bacterium]|nr:GTPase domain-containing protein [Polyangiaceae bacterium]